MGNRPQGAVLLALVLVAASSLAATAASRTSEHFEIFSEGGFATAGYALLVEQSLETAYAAFQTEGFSSFPGLIRVELVEDNTGELGAEYLEQDEEGGWIPVIEIAAEAVMDDYLTYAYVDTSLQDLVASTCAHELFHVFQDYHSQQGTGDISEQAFVEAQATAIQEFVFPEANDYLEPSLDFLLAPDSMAFFERSYDAAVFWVYVLDRFGPQLLLQLMDSSARYEGRYAIDHALAPLGQTFFDVWTNFAVALATGTLPDADVIASLVPLEEGSGWWTRTRDPAPIPPVVCRAAWSGNSIDLTEVNAGNESEYIPTYEDDPIGAELRVAHAYGIDIIEITLEDRAPIAIRFEGDPETAFRTVTAVESDGSWTSTVFEASILLQPDASATRIRVIVTRSEPGTGAYTVTLRPQ
jgi:hypothetical protein